jgi:hypothetical protein
VQQAGIEALAKPPYYEALHYIQDVYVMKKRRMNGNESERMNNRQ